MHGCPLVVIINFNCFVFYLFKSVWTLFQARITKFAAKVYVGALQNPIGNGVDWPWPSRSFGAKTVQIGQKQACPCIISSRFRARITKFAPNVYLWTLQNPIENGVDWPWPSRSFGVILTILLNVDIVKNMLFGRGVVQCSTLFLFCYAVNWVK